MSLAKANPDKKSSTIGIHKSTLNELKADLARYIGSTGEVISLVDFLDKVIAAGLKAVRKKSKY